MSTTTPPRSPSPRGTQVPPPGRGRPRRGLADAAGSLVWFLLAWAIMVGAWETLVRTDTINGVILPPPSEWVPYLVSGPGSAGIGPQQLSYGSAVGTTVARVFTGLVIGLVIALILGSLIAWVRPVRRVVLPMVQTIAPIAPVAWVPVVIAVVGIGDRASVAVVVLAVAASMTIATAAAITAVPRTYVKTARSLGASGVQTALLVVAPAAFPSLITMVRLNLFAAWMAVLAGEMAGVDAGLGALTLMGQQQFNMRLVMVGVVTIGVLGFASDQALLAIQRRLRHLQPPREGDHA